MSGSKEYSSALDIVKIILVSLVKVVLVLVWWLAMLFIASLILTGVWKVTWEKLVIMAGVFTVVTCVIYGIWGLIKSKSKKR